MFHTDATYALPSRRHPSRQPRPAKRETTTIHFSVSLVVIVLLGLAPVASESVAAGATRVIHVMSFDSSRHDFYWYGHHMGSPVTFMLDGSTLRANGIAPELPDTSGANRILAGNFDRVPFVANRVARGMSYVEAVNDYGCALLVLGRAPVRAYRDHLAAGNKSRIAALSAVDTTIVDMSLPISVDSTTFAASLFDGNHYRHTYSARDLLAPDPCIPSSSIELEADLKATLEALEGQFTTSERVVVVAVQGGYVSFSGTRADRVRALIQRASPAAHAAVPGNFGDDPDVGLLPPELLRQIRLHAGEPAVH